MLSINYRVTTSGESGCRTGLSGACTRYYSDARMVQLFKICHPVFGLWNVGSQKWRIGGSVLFVMLTQFGSFEFGLIYVLVKL